MTTTKVITKQEWKALDRHHKLKVDGQRFVLIHTESGPRFELVQVIKTPSKTKASA